MIIAKFNGYFLNGKYYRAIFLCVQTIQNPNQHLSVPLSDIIISFNLSSENIKKLSFFSLKIYLIHLENRWVSTCLDIFTRGLGGACLTYCSIDILLTLDFVKFVSLFQLLIHGLFFFKFMVKNMLLFFIISFRGGELWCEL